MNTKVPLKFVPLSFALLLVACASSGVYPLAGDKLMISKNTAKVGGGISAAATSEVHQEADAYCAELKKKVEVTDLQMSPGRFGSLGNVTLQFRCI